MIRNISIGIDIGSSMTRVVVGEFAKKEKGTQDEQQRENIPKIIGIGEAPTQGARNGYIVNTSLASESLKKALALAEKTSGIKIKRAYITVGGITLRGDQSSGVAIISKADGEVTSLDIKNALADSESNINLTNKKIVQIFPLSFRLDGKDVLGRLEGMRGTKLEAKALFVTCSIQHLEDLLETVALAGIEPIDVIASPVAASSIALSEKQKIVGSALVNIGSETTSISIFENGVMVSLHTFSIGSEDITNDIALGLKITLEKAEDFKLGNLGTSAENFSKKKLDEITSARLSDIFELIENHLKKIKRSELLPAGIVFVGGGANTPGLEELSKSALNLPSTVGTTEIFGAAKTKLRDPSWFTVLGLLITDSDGASYNSNSFGGIFKDIKGAIKSGIKQLMP